ncbi:MAG: YfhO family protein [Lachnospiraceae bacterium]|nr:YfhO family protein [Lachnospiraceae bacterium]
MEKRQSIIENFVIILCVTLIWSLGCAYKSIYPFGNNLMDVGDMQGQIVPIYTFLWDVLHGNKAFFFDWSIGLGNNMAGAAWHFTLISPFNLFFLFIERSQIEEQLFLFLLIKLIAIGMSFRFVIRKWFSDLKPIIVLAFTLLYVFCPFSIEYYRFPAWLDVVFMFPLVMYFYFELMNHRRIKGFTICLTMVAVMNFQHTFLLVVFLVFTTGGLLLLDREKYRDALFALVRAAAVAAGISAFVWVPGILQIMTGARFSDGTDIIDIWNSIWFLHPSKWLKCFNVGIPLGMFLFAVFRHKQDKKIKIWYCYVLALLGFPIFLESSNILWHGGFYQGYTMRFSYMLTFWCVMAGIWGYSALRNDGKEPVSRKTLLYVIVSVVLLAGLIVLSINIIQSENNIIKTGITIAVSIVLGMLLLLWKKYEETVMLLVSVLLSFLLVGSNILVSYSVDNSDIGIFNRIWESGYRVDVLSRVKAESGAWLSNYTMNMGGNSISNYMAAEGADQINSYLRLGYAKIGIRMSDYGGTLFSDALLGVKELVCNDDSFCSADLYQPARIREKHYSIHDCKYTYPIGILTDSQTDITYGEDVFANQNAISNAVCGVEFLKCYETNTEEIILDVASESILYAYVPAGSGIEGFTVTDMVIGTEKEQNLYDSKWENGIINLGTWGAGTFKVTIHGTWDETNVQFALLSMDAFKNNQPLYAQNVTYEADQNSISLHAECEDINKSLFLPIYADQGWKCRVNGKKVAIDNIISGGMLIPMEQGDNEIELVYYSPGLYAGLLCSLVTILMVILCFAGKRSYKVLEGKANCALQYVVYVVYGGMILVFYFVPIIFLLKYLLISCII